MPATKSNRNPFASGADMCAAYEDNGVSVATPAAFGRPEIKPEQVSIAPVDDILCAKLGDRANFEIGDALAHGQFRVEDMPVGRDGTPFKTVTWAVLERNMLDDPWTSNEDREEAIQEYIAAQKRFGNEVTHDQAAKRVRKPGPAVIKTIGKWRPGMPEEQREQKYLEVRSQQLWQVALRDPKAEREAREKRAAEAKKTEAKEAADAKNAATATKVKPRVSG